MKKDMKPEQEQMIRFEMATHREALRLKKTGVMRRASLGVALAALSGAITSASAKLNAPELVAYSDAAAAKIADTSLSDGEVLTSIAKLAAEAHSKVELMAQSAQFDLFNVGGGPKRMVPAKTLEILQSVPGLF